MGQQHKAAEAAPVESYNGQYSSAVGDELHSVRLSLAEDRLKKAIDKIGATEGATPNEIKIAYSLGDGLLHSDLRSFQLLSRDFQKDQNELIKIAKLTGSALDSLGVKDIVFDYAAVYGDGKQAALNVRQYGEHFSATQQSYIDIDIPPLGKTPTAKSTTCKGEKDTSELCYPGLKVVPSVMLNEIGSKALDDIVTRDGQTGN